MTLPIKAGTQAATVILVLAMIGLIVGLDLEFFRGRSWFWERLAANIGVVLLFGAVYVRFVGRR